MGEILVFFFFTLTKKITFWFNKYFFLNCYFRENSGLYIYIYVDQ